MVESFFQFKDPLLIKLEYKENDSFDSEKFEQLKLDFGVSVNKENDSNAAFVALKLKIGENINSPFYLKIVMGSEFTWLENKDEFTINELLNINAPVLLTGYMRPIVSLITSSSRFPTFNLPFLDFTRKYHESKIQEIDNTSSDN